MCLTARGAHLGIAETEDLCMAQTSCHSYFAICSSGEIRDGIGFVAAENSYFDPDDITAKLGIAPFDKKKMGALRKNGYGHYPFSNWACCRQDEPALDAEEQCRRIVRLLRPFIPHLQEIKKEYNVDYSIIIVPHICNEENPVLGFDSEIIEFCYETGTEISVDMYIYDKE